MPRFALIFRCFLFASATWFMGCEKETFDVTVTEFDVPSPEVIASVDCPGLMLDVGDACELNGGEGMVSAECECITSDSGDLIALEFINDSSFELVATVETEPPFLAGLTYVVIPPYGTTVSYYLPDGITAFSSAAFFVCSTSGILNDVASYSNTSSVEGAIVQLHVGCP